MKKVILMRHAKSSWDSFGLSDHERGLNERGETDAPVMGEQIKLHNILPQAVYSSNSERTTQTLNFVSTKLPIKDVVFTRKLYLATEHEILQVINAADNKYDCILILAHNPGITDAFKLLANINIDNVPTAGVGCITFKVNSFAEIEPEMGSLDYFIYPKMY
jgi:phosphohistidine phosphatase